MDPYSLSFDVSEQNRAWRSKTKRIVAARRSKLQVIAEFGKLSFGTSSRNERFDNALSMLGLSPRQVRVVLGYIIPIYSECRARHDA